MYLQGVDSVFDLCWSDGPLGRVSYGDVYHQNEVEMSKYNFEHADVPVLFRQFDEHEAACAALLGRGLALPAYEQVLKASHAFNLLDARRAISVTERQRFILRVRAMARSVAESYYASREALGFPMLQQARETAAWLSARISWSKSAPRNCRPRRSRRSSRPSATDSWPGWPRRGSATARWSPSPRRGAWPSRCAAWRPARPTRRSCCAARRPAWRAWTALEQGGGEVRGLRRGVDVDALVEQAEGKGVYVYARKTERGPPRPRTAARAGGRGAGRAAGAAPHALGRREPSSCGRCTGW
jgi:hypothetical protein